MPELPGSENFSVLQAALRPQTLDQFVGQEDVKNKLSVKLISAKSRKTVPEHILFSGPPGTGKTSLAGIIANEMGGRLHKVHAPTVSKPKDIIQTIIQVAEGDVLFIDEIHRLPPAAAEMLYPAMEDSKLNFMTGVEAQAQTIELDLPAFTLVAATTRVGSLPRPLQDRFGMELRLELYNESDLAKLVLAKAAVLGLEIGHEAALVIARRGRGTPRVAIQLLRWARDCAIAREINFFDSNFAEAACNDMGVDQLGLNGEDRKYLKALLEASRTSPAGLSLLASLLATETETIERSVEPYIMRLGLIERTPRGRVLTNEGLRYLNELEALDV